MSHPRVKHRPVVHQPTTGILKSIPEAVDLVGNPPQGLTKNGNDKLTALASFH
jgi:hypothetical protein